MINFHRLLAAALLLGGLSLVPPAQAAESYDNCTGFIDSLPATISTQGTWCLRQNLSTNIANGDAVTIATNNVTIDCNDFRIGGLAAGKGSNATGIYAHDRQNLTVRRCGVRGFRTGIRVNLGAGHSLEDNRLDNNLSYGIHATNVENSLVRNNRIYDTGGRLSGNSAYGIHASADIVGNTIAGLYADVAGGTLMGIHATGDGTRVHGNNVSGFDTATGDGGSVWSIIGIQTHGRWNMRVSGNHIAGSMSAANNSGTGISGSVGRRFCVDNTVAGFTTNITSSCISSGNLTP